MSQGQESFLGIEETGIFATEQLILAKHHMTQQVYAHRVRVITDYMIVRGLELAIDGGLAEIKELYEYDGSPEFCQRYVTYHDDSVADIMMNCRLDEPRRIYQRLHSRRLFKQLVRLPITDRYIDDAVLRSRYVNISPESKHDLQERIADYLKCESWEVIIEIKNIKNPAYQDVGILNPEAILIQDRDGRRKTMNEYDELVTGKLPSTDTFYVIAPYEWSSPNDRQSRSKERSTIEKCIKGIVDSRIGGSE